MVVNPRFFTLCMVESVFLIGGEGIVMKHVQKYFGCVAVCLLLCCVVGCGGEEYEDTTNPIEGLRMAVCEETVTGAGLSVSITNDTGRTYSYGAQFSIEKKKGRGWALVEPVGSLAVDDWCRPVEPGETATNEYVWAGYYGALAKGEYRILTDVREADTGEMATLSAAFTIR